MNPDFAIVLNFKLNDAKNVDADFLVKTARDIGARAIAVDQMQDEFVSPCVKYTISLVEPQTGLDLDASNVINAIVANRQNGKATFINVNAENGQFEEHTQKMLTAVNRWMHLFGHAFNESKPAKLSANSGFILQNRHMPYQKYLFINAPLPKEVTVTGLEVEPTRVEMIEKRTELKFAYQNQQLTIDLDQVPASDMNWQVIRIQAHRPEDDIKETKF